MTDSPLVTEGDERKCRSGLEDICELAVRLINQNLDFDALTLELSNSELYYHGPPNEYNDGNKAPDAANEHSILESLKLQASMSDMKIEVAASQMILKKLSLLAKEHSIISTDLSHLSAAISAFEKVEAKLNLEEVTQCQRNVNHCLPLDALLELQERKILDIKDYLMINVNTKRVLKEFIWSLQQLTRQHGQKTTEKCKDSAEVSSGILSHLITCAFGSDKSCSRALKKMCSFILFNVMKSHLYHLIALPACKMVASESTKIIPLIKERWGINDETLQKCFLRMVTLWIRDSPTLQVSDAISTQHTWTASKQNDALILFYKEMTSCIGADKTVSALNDILERTLDVNWKHLLTFTSALLVNFTDVRIGLENLVAERLKDGIENLSIEPLAISFLFARQLSLEGSHAFSSYTTWFQDSFGGQSTLLNSSRAARFLLRFLTDIAPHEPAKYLKAHVIKPPSVPSSCAESLKEYAMLARVRIAELGCSLTEITDDSTNVDEIEKDIQKVLAEYEKNWRVPKSLMEASIFQKAYFCKKFLPALLKPRPLPSVPDASMKLIEDLHKLQKIPKNMYSTYVEGCKLENKKLLEEVMILDDDSAFEDDENPQDQFCKVLEMIKSEISQNLTSNLDKSISCGVITKMNRILCATFDDKTTRDDEKIAVNLNIASPKNKIANKIVHSLLNWLGGLEDFLVLSLKDSSHGLDGVFNAFRQHNTINTEVCRTIWELTINELTSTSDKMLRGISLYLIIIGVRTEVKSSLPKFCKRRILQCNSFVKTIENWQTIVKGDLLSTIVHNLHFYESEDSMLSSFNLVCHILQTSFSLQKDCCCWAFGLFKFLGKRIATSSKEEHVVTSPPPAKSPKLDGIIAKFKMCQKLYNKLSSLLEDSNKISPSEFFESEMTMNTNDDILNSKQRRHLYSEIFFMPAGSESEVKSLILTLLDLLIIHEDLTPFPNQEVIVFVFKNLPLLFESCEGVMSNSKFMYELLIARLLQDKSDDQALSSDIFLHNQVRAMSTLVKKLNPSFLFRQQSLRSHEQEDMFGCKKGSHISLKKENLYFAGKLINQFLFYEEKDPSLAFSLNFTMTMDLLAGVLECPMTEAEFLHFSIFTCPFIFISILTNWGNGHEVSLILKLRKPELHSLINTIHSILRGNSALILAHKALQSKVSLLLESDSDGDNSSFCLAAAMCDMSDTDSQEHRLTGLVNEGLGCIACCAALKIDLDYQNEAFHVQRRNANLLQACLSALDPEYVCNEVMQGNIRGLQYIIGKEGNWATKFSVPILRALSMIDVPRQLIQSSVFLNSLWRLKKSVTSLFSDIILAEITLDLRKLEKIALRNAPTAAVVDALKRFPEDCKLRFESERRKLRLF